MKVILVGYPGSQCIVPASKYLTSKYLSGFDITYLNYTGEIDGWASYVADYLKQLTDERIIFALDDYLISEPIRHLKFAEAEAIIHQSNGIVACVKLCNSTKEEHEEYPVTTQYTIWDRKYLIEILSHVYTPWQFEIDGSVWFKRGKKISFHYPCITYFTNSAISSRWEGIKYDGLKDEDMIAISNYRPWTVEGLTSKTVIFGGSGFLGISLIERLISLGNQHIVAIARNEGALVALKEKFPYIEIIVGDIADQWIVKKAMKDATAVFLLSALKHVGLAEIEVKSCINTNVIGCMNVVNESLITKPKTFMFISTDKASQPIGVYGCSKKIGEKLIAEAEVINPDTKYRVVRYGNVWGSTGSIITKWKPKMERGEEIILTDPEASRFFWTVNEAVDLIFECIDKANDATPYVPKMKAVKMGVVLMACMEVYGNCPVKVIGLQPGENKVETTDGIVFSDQVEQFSKEEFKQKFLCQ